MDNSNTSPFSEGALSEGVIYKKTKASFTVFSAGRMIACGLALESSPRRSATGRPALIHGRDERILKAHAPQETLAVGDRVRFAPAGAETGTIVAMLPRRNKLARRSPVPMPTAQPHEMVIAANLDQVVPVFAAAQPAPKWGMLDRYLVSAEAAGLPALIVITKLDLARSRDGGLDEEIAFAAENYRQIGYPLILTSAATGEGLEALQQALQGRISAFLGKSGVGKSSLLNALEPGLGLRVNAVSQATGKGKHTTTHMEMFPLSFGGAVVDTPGVREFGLWELDEGDLALYFPEMRPLVGRCRFGLGCQHDEEPGCAIRRAVNAGEISPHRYQSYLRLRAEA